MPKSDSYTNSENNEEDLMIASFNPLDRVIENPKYPLARIYRKSFWTGISDTFDVLVGNHYPAHDHSVYEQEKTHLGVLDILLFPLFAQWLMRIAYPELKGQKPIDEEFNSNVKNEFDKDNTKEYKYPDTMPMPIRILAGAIAYLLEVPRILLGSLLTLVLIPIVAFVHAALFYKSHSLKNEAKNLQINSSLYSSSFSYKTTIREFLRVTNYENFHKSYDEDPGEIVAASDAKKFTIDLNGKQERIVHPF